MYTLKMSSVLRNTVLVSGLVITIGLLLPQTADARGGGARGAAGVGSAGAGTRGAAGAGRGAAGVPAAGRPGYGAGAPGAPAAGRPGYGAAGAGATNVNRNVNVNNNVNVNRNVNAYGGAAYHAPVPAYGYRGAYYNDNHYSGGEVAGAAVVGLAVGAMAGAAVANSNQPTNTTVVVQQPASGLVIGTNLNNLPANCAGANINGIQYFQCGSSWMRAYSGYYQVVPAPY